MIKVRKELILIIVAILAFSCKHDNALRDNETQHVNIRICNKKELLSDFFEDAPLVIKLETTYNNLLADLLKVQVSDNYIYILDSSGSLMKFEISGKFIKKIRPIGKGPGEYLSANSFDVSGNGREVIVNDFGGKKLVSFDSNLEFLDSKQLDFTTSRIAIKDSSCILCYTPYNNKNNRHNLYQYNTESEVVEMKSIKRSDAYSTKIPDRFPFIRTSQGVLLFHDSRFNAVYEVSEKIAPSYIMNFQSAELAGEDVYRDREQAKRLIYTNEKYIRSYFFYTENNNHFVSYVSKKKQFLFLQFANGETLSSGEVYDDLGIGYTNDIYSYLNFDGMSDGAFIYSCNPGSVISPEHALYEQLKDVKPSDNPVLVFLKMRTNAK